MVLAQKTELNIKKKKQTKQPTKMGRRSPRIMEIKAKINKWDLLKLKSFSTSKEIINKTKRQPTDWEKIFANDVTDKGLVSKIYRL